MFFYLVYFNVPLTVIVILEIQFKKKEKRETHDSLHYTAPSSGLSLLLI